MRRVVVTFLKGFVIGGANVIPGVSGGTMAFITGVYEPIIEGLRKFDLDALRLLLRGDLAGFSTRVNLGLFVPLGLGAVVSVLTLAKLLKFLLIGYEVWVWAFFFGLILASVPYVGRMVGRWSVGPKLGLLVGTLVALGLAFLSNGAANNEFWYLGICGVVAMCSMIVPGLSGSYVLMLMGNYQLIMLDAVNDLRQLDFAAALPILVPVGVGAVFGLVMFAHLLGYLLKRFRGTVIAILTGFVAGSLLTIWPWKAPVYLRDEFGEVVTKNGEAKVLGYEWLAPAANVESLVAVGLILAGCLTIIAIEKVGSSNTRRTAQGEELF